MRNVAKLQIGVYDDPKNQKQAIFELDLTDSNIIVYGTAMSGKTTFIKTLLVRMHESYTPRTENVYIVDFSGALLKYRNLEFVCGCFDNSNEENIKRLFNKLESILGKNTKILSGTPFREYTKANKPAHVTFIIENFNGFLADKRYEPYQEKLMKMCREGLSKGITVILTASDTSGGVNPYISNFGQKISFEMPNDKLAEIFGPKVSAPMSLPGRGLTVISNQVYEFQCFLPFKTENPLKYNEEKEFNAFSERINLRYTDISIEKIGSFDGELNVGNFHDFSAGNQTFTTVNQIAISTRNMITPVTVGLDYYEMRPVILDLAKTPSIAIYGKKQGGKTNLLWLLVESAINLKNENGLRFVLFDDGRKQLEEIKTYLEDKGTDIQLFSQVSDLECYLFEKGYCDTGYYAEEFIFSDNPFTVFIMQSRTLFTGKAEKLTGRLFPEMISESEKKWMFIFSDTQNITEGITRDPFNDSLSAVFLLRDIAEYVRDKGSKSVFGNMDEKELKEQFARIEQGDGYFYDIDSDNLVKLKFIYSDELKKREKNREED